MFLRGSLLKLSGLRSVLPSGSPLEQSTLMDLFHQCLEVEKNGGMRWNVSDHNRSGVKIAADGRFLLLMSKSRVC